MEYYKHLIFDNSLTPESYYFSHVKTTAPSDVESIDEKLPVATKVFFSPPNCLKLSWLSREGGDWAAEVRLEPWRGRDKYLSGDTLSFWVYSENTIPSSLLPLVWVDFDEYPGDNSLRKLKVFMDDIPARRWLQVKVPLQEYPEITSDFNVVRIKKLIFTQNARDGESHTLFIDEIKILDSSKTGETHVPNTLETTAYDHHVDLSWPMVDDQALEYILIYRSEDGMDFRPIGIQNPTFNRYSDFIGPVHGMYHYKIAAVGHDYSVSKTSGEVSATTHPLSDDELLTMVQEASFHYYWENAHPDAGLALECIPGKEHLIALGASGFGVLAIITAIARGFITRDAGVERMLKILGFLGKADRFHGVWPHFLDGRTGKVVPFFGKYDNGGDLIETSFMIQGLLAARQFFNRDSEPEHQIRGTITALWESVEWSWYRMTPDSDFLFWHWSPDHEWHINHPFIGWNEAMVVYLLAIASPTYPVSASMYYSGWASQSKRAQKYRTGWGKTIPGKKYKNGKKFYGITLPVGVGMGGPLFFTHYSYLGFDPRKKRDKYANYYENNRAISLINQAYCIDNPGKFKGYSEACWGLTASDDHTGYVPHEPHQLRDNGTMTPTGALASFPYTPEESMLALKHFYYDLGALIWDIHGFRDAFNLTVNFVSRITMGLNQAPITVMIENYRSGLLWDLFMANPEILPMLEKIGFAME